LPREEKIEVLTLLTASPDAPLRATALATLQGWDYMEVRRVLASPLTAPDVLRVAAEQLLAAHEELREVLLWNPSLPEDTRRKLQLIPPTQPARAETVQEIVARLAEALQQEDDAKVLQVLPPEIEAPPEVTKEDDQLSAAERVTLLQKVTRMNAVEKIKAALTGNMETRMILVRDSNKVVARAVLQSPKISDAEIEAYASAKNVSDEVLRLIATNRRHMRTYVVPRALVNNPRAPIDVTLPLINRLNARDLKALTLNRNVPDVIRGAANKLVKQKEEASKVKLPGKH
jgi:hypothetical protein